MIRTTVCETVMAADKSFHHRKRSIKMSIHSHRDLQNNILQNLGFHSVKGNHCTRFANKSRPEDGIFVLYERPGLYSLAAADYTAATSFSLAFESEETVLRFGSFYDGKTLFEIEGITSHSSSPSSFLVREEKIKGRQFWNAGQHCRGIEFALFPAFLKQLKTIDPHASVLDSLSQNRTYHSLPPAVITIFHQLLPIIQTDSLTPLMLEGCLLQCMGILTESIRQGALRAPDVMPSVFLGRKKITFDEFDLSAVQQAKQILTENPANAPTISQLSKQVCLNEQKLKAGFSMCFHMTIGRYLKECRMAKAADLLTSTSLSVREIGLAVGYTSSAAFIKTFRQHYKMTPQKFRCADTPK